MKSVTWSYPTEIRFGAGRRAELGPACRALGIRRPLLVTDAGLLGLDSTTDLIRGLGRGSPGLDVFSDIRSNPAGADVDAGVRVFRAGRHDGVVALGGGSALDVGKLVAFMSGQRRPLWDFEDRDDWWTRADSDGIAPVVAVPTTAGTGSEAGRAAVVVDETARTKRVVFHPRMLPGIVISDPELTVGLPPALTAATGMDALSHCLEAFCAPAFHPLSEGIALEGMRLVRENLVRAFERGNDIEARGGMLAAASMGAIAFQKGLGAMHAMSHPIGALYDTHHGLTNAVVMPYVLAFNRGAIEGKVERLAAFLGIGSGSFDDFLAWVVALRETLEIPPTLAALGLTEIDTERLVAMALADPSAPGNPVALTSANMAVLFEHAYRGVLE